jgi:hypothetical protein
MGDISSYPEAIRQALNDLIAFVDDRSSSSSPWPYPILNKIDKCYSFENAQKLLVFSDIVTRHNIEVEHGNPNPTPVNPPLFDVVQAINARVEASIVNVLYLFYSSTLNLIVICFTGTYNEALWLVDFDYPQLVPTGINNYIDGLKVHGGFWKLYSRVNTQIYTFLEKYVKNNTQVLITGISLGGGMSSLCMYDLYGRVINNCPLKHIVHYSFASPRVFNTIGANYYDYLHMFSYRVVNSSDIVPMLPFPIMPIREDFTHVNEQIYFNINLGSYGNNHTTAYRIKYDINL